MFSVLAFIFGGCAFVIYPLSISHASDFLEEHEILGELKLEIDKYYPNRGYETLISYFIPFVAFYKVLWRMIEMMSFFSKNQNARMFDYMVYRYQKEISLAKDNASS